MEQVNLLFFSSYTMVFKPIKYRLTGHVYEKSYYDKVIEDKERMLEVIRYIHLNPVV
jgi:hypothetical protein